MDQADYEQWVAGDNIGDKLIEDYYTHQDVYERVERKVKLFYPLPVEETSEFYFRRGSVQEFGDMNPRWWDGAEDCQDDPNFFDLCKRVAKKPIRMCNKKKNRERCPHTCGECPCQDETRHRKGCKWFGKKVEKRCGLLGVKLRCQFTCNPDKCQGLTME